MKLYGCYAHGDSEIVYPEMVWLREQGTNLWYDEVSPPVSTGGLPSVTPYKSALAKNKPDGLQSE